MTFQIHSIPADDFAFLADLSEADRAARAIQLLVSDGHFPCRVSLEDVPEGETVFLLNYEHLPAASPYRSRHAVFVRENAQAARVAPGTVPASIASRLLSVRGIDAGGNIVDAEVIDGTNVPGLLDALFENPAIAEIHLHYARRGCFAARATRSGSAGGAG